MTEGIRLQDPWSVSDSKDSNVSHSECRQVDQPATATFSQPGTCPPQLGLRAIDWLVRGTGGGNKYLLEFCNSERYARTLDALLHDPKFSGWSCRKSKQLRKEIAESLAVVHRVEESIARLEQAMPGSCRDLLIVDLCSGKGLSGAMLSFCFPRAKIVLLDNDKHMLMGHLDGCANATFYNLDIYSAAAEELIATQVSQHTAGILVGVHLCGDLSRRAIDLWHSHSLSAMILSPCCLVHKLKDNSRRPAGTFGYDTKDRARQLRVDNYMLWCLTLLHYIPRESGSRDLSWDDDMLSTRNAFVTAIRSNKTSVANA